MPHLSESDWVAHYRAIEKPLYNVVYRWVWDAGEAQDVVQEAFLRTWRIRHKIEAATFRALVYRTALRLASNRRRRKKLWKFVPFVSEPEAASKDGPEAHRLSADVRAAVDELSPRLKQVVLLSELAGFSYKEIAEVLGIAEGTVGSRRTRALAQLRAKLGESME